MTDAASAFDIAASGMAAQRLSMDVIAQNLANANVQQADGSVYRARAAMFEPSASFSDAMQSAVDAEFNVSFDDDATPAGVRFAGLIEQPSVAAYRLDPSNPLALAAGPHKGYVEVSDVDPIAQMVGLVAAGRTYDADVSALQAAKQMDTEAIDIEQL
ncbi:MAG TPA: flagellar basal body rod protein FlgC [Magnetospirillaceae bacterium]|nr:flagellar basal body rod protein FlgC [Magnetospirillaceae bacterium]